MSANISDVCNFFRIWKKFLDTLIDDATIFWGKRSEFLSCLSFLQDTFLYSLRDITTSSKHSAGFFWSNLCTKPIQRFINCVKAVIHAVDCSFNNTIWITAKTIVPFFQHWSLGHFVQWLCSVWLPCILVREAKHYRAIRQNMVKNKRLCWILEILYAESSPE